MARFNLRAVRRHLLPASRADIARVLFEVREIRELMATEQEVNDQLGAVIGLLIAEVQSVRESDRIKTEALTAAQTALEQERSERDAMVSEQVASALELDSASDTARVQAYLERIKNEAGIEVPEVAVPAPGQPAEPPADSGVEVPGVPVDDSGTGRPDQPVQG
jgi:hypothetical protein